MEEGFRGTWISSRYPDYMNDILYYPSEWSEDMSHFGGEYAERDKLNETIERAYEKTVLLQKLKLDMDTE